MILPITLTLSSRLEKKIIRVKFLNDLKGFPLPRTGKLEECNQDLVTVYRQHFEKALNATNLGLLVDACIRRSDLSIVRELDANKKKVRL